ncbi:uncharacterized protein [Chelonus insularis]|uniref:uncharacterized protein isoform X2 n=1 Tax=Chelonus insularis TaxID=460826 RepID=UPI00158B9B12|nr:uncharacterized protein LOC118065598 isoform X2 [Chelonus insularis]
MYPCRRRMSTRDILALMMVILYFIGSINPIAAVDKNCENDADCSSNQYCYKTSYKCVNYTKCSIYFRQEGEKQAQSSSQCGPCLPGYTAELLTTGKPAEFCNKNSGHAPNDIIGVVVYIIGSLAIIILIVVVALLLRRPTNFYNKSKLLPYFKKCSSIPTAPIPDNDNCYSQPPYFDGPPDYSVTNNNHSVKDQNRLLQALPTVTPAWIEKNPNYTGRDDLDASSTVSNNVPEDEETNPSSWTPEGVTTIQVPARPFHQFASEQRDNVINHVTVREDCASNSGPNEETTHEPTPEPTDNSHTTSEHHDLYLSIQHKMKLSLLAKYRRD